MDTALLVISWWSNCLGLRCIDRLAKFAPEFPIIVLQNGKSKAQQQKFRSYLSPHVREICYPEDQPAEHFAVLDWLFKNHFHKATSIWFIDHDAFLTEDATLFFLQMETALLKSHKCLLTPAEKPLTQPGFWISPARMPKNVPSFAPYPKRTSIHSKRPDLWTRDLVPEIPINDTLCRVKEYLAQIGMSASYPFDFFPKHQHIGGLHALMWSRQAIEANLKSNPQYKIFLIQSIQRLSSFFRSCPKEWLQIEEPNLLDRFKWMEAKL